MNPADEVILHHLGSAARNLLRKTAEGCRDGTVADPGGHWVVTMASFLDGMPLAFPPIVDRHQETLPFRRPHQISAEVFSVARGGAGGGPAIDVLVQIWLETESIDAAFGVPLLFRQVPDFGPVPRAVWEELRDVAKELNAVTGSGRLVMISEPGTFEPRLGDYFRNTDGFSVLPTLMVAGMIDPPRGLSGHILDRFADDLVSGWVGDPNLAGRGKSRVMQDALHYFDIGRLLRIGVRGAP